MFVRDSILVVLRNPTGGRTYARQLRCDLDIEVPSCNENLSFGSGSLNAGIQGAPKGMPRLHYLPVFTVPRTLVRADDADVLAAYRETGPNDTSCHD